MENRKFIIECEVPERWVNDFCSMLATMQSFGQAGHSEVVGIYADGDGDFRPVFNIHTDYNKTSPVDAYRYKTIYDAG
jgi:hypothetical protein